MDKLLLTLSAITTLSLNAQIEYPGSAAVNTGATEVVFNYDIDKCNTEDIPDVPTRVFRDASGTINLIASHFTNWRMTGNDFSSLTKDCNPIMSSHQSSNAGDFNNNEWISATYTADGKNIHALVHNEYVPCGNWNNCWYNSITYASSSDSGATFTHASAPNHLVAASPYQSPYPNTHSPFGIFGGSNIIEKDGYYYKMLQLETYQAQQWGAGIMRTNNLSDPASWRGWDGTGFTVQFVNPYTQSGYTAADHVLEPVSRDQIGKMCASISYNSYFGKYILVDFTVGEVNGVLKYGFYYSLSNDLIHWSTKQFIMQVQPTWAVGGANYPSLIDHNDVSRNFEVTGQSCFLYYTKWNSGTYDRDLVRVPITFSKKTVTSFVVNSSGDLEDATPGDGICKTTSNLCSFRAAIQESNARPTYDGYDTVALPITFAITSGANAVKTIKPASYLPEMLYPTYIDGYTQTGSSANTNNFNQGLNTTLNILLDAEDGGAHALAYHCGNNTLKGMAIINGNIDFLYEDGYSKSKDENNIEGCYIGVGADGMTAYWGAININNQSHNNIGANSNASRNLIVGGIILNKSNYNEISNNYFGSDYSGMASTGTGAHSIEINDSCSYNNIGGSTSTLRNLISGGNRGVVIGGANTQYNEILGNYIGIACDGISGLGNNSSGITLNNSTHNNTIGALGAANVICDNSSGEAGIWMEDTYSNTIQSNFIGTDATQTYALGNGDIGNFCGGIIMKGACHDNMIGGLNSNEGNVIACNNAHGIIAFGDVGNGNAFLSNLFYANQEMAIDLGADDYPNGNDNQDGDSGPNDNLNFPEFNGAYASANDISITGTFNSAPNGTYKIQYYVNDSCDAMGNGEGQILIGTETITTDGSGDATINKTLTVTVNTGQYLSALATDGNNSTSEFAACQIVDVATSVSSISKNTNTLVFPTITKEQVYIQSTQQFTYTLHDEQGKLMLQGTSNASTFVLNIASLNDGIYFLKTQNESSIQQHKIIKQ